MTQKDAGSAPQEFKTGDASERQSEPVKGIESISLGEATSFAEIEQRANQLLDYISKLSSPPIAPAIQWFVRTSRLH